jgi:hypothetical protein
MSTVRSLFVMARAVRALVPATVLRRDEILYLPPSARTVSQEEIDALDAKRIRRLRELGQWRPSRGWHIEPAV